MQENTEETVDISKKKSRVWVVISIITVLIIIIGAVLYLNSRFQEKPLIDNPITNSQGDMFWSSESVTYYVGDVPVSFLDNTMENENDYMLINTYSEFLEAVNKIDSWEGKVKEYGIDERDKEIVEENFRLVRKALNEETFDETYFGSSSLLLVEQNVFGSVLQNIDLRDVCINDTELNVNIEYRAIGVTGDSTVTMFCITLPKKEIENIANVNVYSERIFDSSANRAPVAYKPIIYLYPNEEIGVTVKLRNSDKITCSYPKYNDGWNVIAKPNGDLKEVDTDKNLYALYYESENVYDFQMENEGFVIRDEETVEFLEEKLSILGLTEREAQEFIIYWLPKLEANKYNYVRFASADEINLNMPLEISPIPDTTIRVLMTYKGLEMPINVEEQQLVSPERIGYVAVEWGGTEIK